MSIPNRSKIPLRGIGKLFTNLPPGVRAKLESAFVEAETQINYHNSASLNNQERRVQSSYVTAPVIVLTQNTQGFDVTWPRLEDRLISFYEAQVALTNNFASPSVYNLTENSLSVEGVGSTVYVRVRGVRWDGDTGNWSNTVSMVPATGGPITYSRGFDDVESFYIANPGYPYPDPIQRLRITPQRQNGGLMIFGALGTAGLGSTGDPTVIVTLNGVTVSAITNAQYHTSDGASPVDGIGCGFGPVFVRHDEFYFGDNESHVATARTTTGSSSGPGVHTNWTAANPTVYNVLFGLSTGTQEAKTKNVQFSNFGFGVPASNTVVGIQVTYEATDNNRDTGVFAEADLLRLSLLDGGVSRANKVSSPDWQTNDSPSTESYGGRTDLWGEVAGYWTPTKINDSGFGVLLRGTLWAPAVGGNRQISATWPTITVYSINETTGEVDIQIRIQATPTSDGALTACTLNVIEFGDAI